MGVVLKRVMEKEGVVEAKFGLCKVLWQTPALHMTCVLVVGGRQEKEQQRSS